MERKSKMTKNELKDNSWGGEGHNNNKRKS